MEESVEKKIRKIAEEKGLDPDDLIELAERVSLPDRLDEVVEAILGDVSTFAQALDKLDKD